MISLVLKDIGMTDKEISLYLALLQSGPSPVRAIALKSGINRGTAYDILKSLQEQGLVSFYDRAKHRYFIAEDPIKLKQVIDSKRGELNRAENKIDEILPELKSLLDNAGDKPVTRYYEGLTGVKTILQDVISTLASLKISSYIVYSSSDIRKYLYEAFPHFNKERLQAQLHVRVLAIGEGGELVGLDERRWLSREKGAPAYILIYAGKVAMISVDSHDQPRGVIVEDAGLAATHRLLFEWAWERAK